MLSISENHVRYGLVSIIIILFSRAFTTTIAEVLGIDFINILWIFCHILILALLLGMGAKINLSFFYNHVGLLILLAFVSILWSDSPSTTLKRSIMLLNTTVFVYLIIENLDLYSFLGLLVTLLVLLFLFGFLIYVVHPDLVTMHGGEYAGQFRGVFNHKNYFGRLSVVGIIFTLVLHHANQIKKEHSWLMLVFFFFSLVISNSSGALVMFVGVLFGYLFLTRFKKVGLDAVIFWGLIISIVVFVLLNFENLLILLGKSPNLTGRTYLWALVIWQISLRPYFGYGYKAYWNGDNPASSAIYDKTWDAPHAHNGILDLGLDLGILGITIYVIGFILLTRKAYSMYLHEKSSELLFVLLIILYSFLSNLVESQILKENEFMWILYVYVVGILFKHNNQTIPVST